MSASAPGITSKEIYTNTLSIYKDALAFKHASHSSQKELIYSGIPLDLRIDQAFRKVAQLPVRDNFKSIFRLFTAREILIIKNASMHLESTPSMQLLLCANKLKREVEVFDETSPSLLRRTWDNASSMALFRTLAETDKQAVYRTFCELIGNPAGDPFLIGQVLFETNDPDLRTFKMEALVTIAAKKIVQEPSVKTIYENAVSQLSKMEKSVENIGQLLNTLNDVLSGLDLRIGNLSKQKEWELQRLEELENRQKKDLKLQNEGKNEEFLNSIALARRETSKRIADLRCLIASIDENIATHSQNRAEIHKPIDELGQQKAKIEARVLDFKIRVAALTQLTETPKYPIRRTRPAPDPAK